MSLTNLYFVAIASSLLPWLCQSFTFDPSSTLRLSHTCCITPSISLSPMKLKSSKEDNAIEEVLDPTIASQFKIVTCSSTSCRKRMDSLGLDEYAILSGLYQRKEDAEASEVTVEETSCLGGCKVGPCVGVEHEDYFGTVSLDGMKPNEFNDSIFHNVVTEDDLDRVWSCVENGIKTMMEEDDE